MSPHYNYGQFFAYFVVDDNATKLAGKHEIQFGVHLRYDQLTYLPQQQHAAGAVGSSSTSTGLCIDSEVFAETGVKQCDPTARTAGAFNNTGSIAGGDYLGFDNYDYRSVKG